MSYRIFLGGIPSWAAPRDLQRWLFEKTGESCDTAVVKHGMEGSTLAVGFLGFSSPAAAVLSLRTLGPTTGFHGHRVSVKWARDSHPVPAETGSSGAGATSKALPSAPPAGPPAVPLAAPGLKASGAPPPKAAVFGAPLPKAAATQTAHCL